MSKRRYTKDDVHLRTRTVRKIQEKVDDGFRSLNEHYDDETFELSREEARNLLNDVQDLIDNWHRFKVDLEVAHSEIRGVRTDVDVSPIVDLTDALWRASSCEY